MPIVFTGLAQDVCVALAQAVGQQSRVRLLSPEETLNLPSARRETQRVVWFYRAPWSMSAPAYSGSGPLRVPETLPLWLTHHRALLRKRRAMGPQLLLVNADRVDFRALFELLGLPTAAAESLATSTRPRSESALSRLLAQAFEASCPEYWDVFEALEVLAWHPVEAPLHEAEHVVLSKSDVLSAFQSLIDARALPDMRTALNEAQTAAEQRAQELARLQQELKLQVDKAAQAATRLSKLQQEKSAADKALLELKRQAQDKEQALRKAAEQEQARLKDLQGQNKHLLLQMHAPQEALEKIHLEKTNAEHAARDKQHAGTAAELARLQQELKLQVDKAAQATTRLSKLQQEKSAADKLLAELKQQAQDKEKAIQQAAKQSQARLKDVQGENELLMQQMHQVQEDLERYFLENRQLQQLIADSNGSLDRARKLISRLMKLGLPVPGLAPAKTLAAAEQAA